MKVKSTFTMEERERLQEEWLHFAETDHTLRVWRNERPAK
ncbi:DUF3658 domain-containing protein [Bacillus pumilus]|nr:DUF3658 domain-containing protein [Bacillus pumilus]